MVDDDEHSTIKLDPERVQALYDAIVATFPGYSVGEIMYAVGSALANAFKETQMELGDDFDVDLDETMPELRRIIEKSFSEMKPNRPN